MNSIIKFSTLLTVIFPLLFMTSCKENDDNDDVEEMGTVDFMLEFNNLVGGHSAISDHSHVVDGDTFDLSLVRYYISKIKLYDDAGTEIASYPDTYILVKGEEENSVMLGELNVGQHVHRVTFNVGIDAATNNQTEDDFNSYPAEDPRAIQSPSMNWTWNSGYIFIKLEGTVNSSNVMLHIGTDDLLRQADVMVHSDVEAGEMFHVKIDADIPEFFDGLDTSSDIMAHMPNATAEKVADNVSKVFSKSGDSSHNHGKK